MADKKKKHKETAAEKRARQDRALDKVTVSLSELDEQKGEGNAKKKPAKKSA